MKIIHDLILQKRSVFMLLFAIVLHCIGQAQGLWNRTYIEDRPTMLFSSIVPDSQSSKVIGIVSGHTTNQAKGMIANIDNSGAISDYKPLGDSLNANYGLFWNTLITSTENKFAFTGYRYDSVPSILLGFANSTLDSIKEFAYHTSNSSALQGYKLIQVGSDFFISGVHTDQTVNSADNLLIKVDSAGNRLWQKYYGISTQMEYARSLLELRNGNLMMGSVRIEHGQTHENARTWLLEVDTGGGFVRQWFDPNDSTYAAEGLKQTQDGGFIYAAQKKNYQSGFSSVSFNATVVKLDYNFSKQWTFSRGGSDLSIYSSINDIEGLPDNSFIVAGNITHYGADTALNGYVARLDSNGEVIWERTYRGINVSQTLNFLTDIDVLPDGNLIAVGQCQHSGHVPPQVGWFLKLDSNGCEIENCVVGIGADHGLQTTDDGGIRVWPNPFNTVLSLALSEGEGTVQSARVTITNLMGQVVYQQTETNLAAGYTKMLDLSYLPNGVYFVAVSTGEGTVVQRVVKE